MYTVTLDNGTSFNNLTVNGSYFVSNSEVNSNMFNNWNGKCRVELISGEDNYNLAGSYEGWELKDLRKGAKDWYFAIGEIDRSTIERLRDRADIEYIAMMIGVQL